MMEEYTQLCVWPGTTISEEKATEKDIAFFEQYFLDEFNVKIKYYTELETKPDLDKNGNDIPETGGRNDLFFYVHNEDIPKFAIPRLGMGIRWWEDVIKYNEGSEHLYSKEFIQDHPPAW